MVLVDAQRPVRLLRERRAEPGGRRAGADRGEHDVGRDQRAVGQRDPVAAHLDDVRTPSQVHARGGVPGCGERTDHRSERGAERVAGGLQHGDVDAGRRRDGRDLGADPARADDDEPGTRGPVRRAGRRRRLRCARSAPPPIPGGRTAWAPVATTTTSAAPGAVVGLHLDARRR